MLIDQLREAVQEYRKDRPLLGLANLMDMDPTGLARFAKGQQSMSLDKASVLAHHLGLVLVDASHGHAGPLPGVPCVEESGQGRDDPPGEASAGALHHEAGAEESAPVADTASTAIVKVSGGSPCAPHDVAARHPASWTAYIWSKVRKAPIIKGRGTTRQDALTAAKAAYPDAPPLFASDHWPLSIQEFRDHWRQAQPVSV